MPESRDTMDAMQGNVSSSQWWNVTNQTWNNYSDYYPMQDEFTVKFYYYLWTFVAPAAFGLITLIGTVGNSLVVYVILSK